MSTSGQGGFPLDAADLRVLARIGFMAADAGQAAVARPLFAALRVVCPGAVMPFVGQAVTEMGVGRHAEAARLLREEGLREHPGAGELAAFLGLALAEAGHHAQADEVLRELVEGQPQPEGHDEPPHVRMARRILSRDRAAPAVPGMLR
jgi:hypothetical protein